MKFWKDEVYIKMCEKATEIQDGIIEYGDCVMFDQGEIAFAGKYEKSEKPNTVRVVMPDLENCYEENELDVVVRVKIFRQDQLIEILQNTEVHNRWSRLSKGGMALETFLQLIPEFFETERLPDGRVAIFTLNKQLQPFDSFEKMFLALIVKIKFNKTWNAEKGEWE
jgi:hypothetical protein